VIAGEIQLDDIDTEPYDMRSNQTPTESKEKEAAGA
jgi:hypothetical protein